MLLVKESERQLLVRFALYEYEKFRSDNTLVAAVQQPLDALYHQIIAGVEAPTSYDLISTWPTEHEFHLRLAMEKQDGVDNAHLQLRGYFIPYVDLRRAFWLRMAGQYGQGDPGAPGAGAIWAIRDKGKDEGWGGVGQDEEGWGHTGKMRVRGWGHCAEVGRILCS